MDSAFGIDIDELSNAFSGDQSSSEVGSSKKIKGNVGNLIDHDSQVSADQKEKIEADLKKYLKRKPAPSDSSNDLSKKIKPADSELGSRISIYKIESEEKCSHQVAVPPNVHYQPLQGRTRPPAKTYPFSLDPFQKAGIKCIDNNQSVLISAHTSAGKTVVAEYAVAVALRDKQRVIYTTPIKALSNQKYRELYEQFKEVGLMTGDVTINPNASILIMTTEILRSMLYRGSSVMREVSWVIFDEIHYMRDKERGVVWEETLILLPDSVRYVFLSATVPNAIQFCEWVACLHKQACHLVATDFRPTPLQHYVFPAGGKGMHLVLDDTGTFLEDNFKSAMSVLSGDSADQSSSSGRNKTQFQKGSFKQGESGCFHLVRLVMERNLEPVIVFSFSKKECEIYALQMAKLDFNNENEKSIVEEVFSNAIDILSENDRLLPQVESVLPLLKKGIGIHHSGLLPILKETVEILFSEGLIKCLFATETFAMGLNMPARTVLFTSARKYDGKSYRWISSGEYIQMAGRAGRRGKDDRGTVILMIDESMPADAGRQIIQGHPDPLNSAFYLSYNMILNLLRVEDINPEYVMERSFFQFQNHAKLPELHERMRCLREAVESMEIEDEELISTYFQIKTCVDAFQKDQLSFIRKPKYIVPFLQPGRLLKIRKQEEDFGWGVVVNIKKRVTQDTVSTPESFYVIECLLPVIKNGPHMRPATKEEINKASGEPQVVPVRLECVEALSAVRLFVPSDLRPLATRINLLQSIEKVQNKLKGNLPLLDPETDMKIADEDFVKLRKKTKAFEERLLRHSLCDDPRLPSLLDSYEVKEKKRKEIDQILTLYEEKKSLIQMDELKARKRILRRLLFSTEEDVIELKGLVACEISTGQELILTELLFDNVFNSLSAQQVAALLSCFVCEQNASEMPSLGEQLAEPWKILQRTARKIAQVSKECRLDIDEEEFVESYKPHLMDIVCAWANGAAFSDICGMTDIYEGNIIRCIRLLEELMRQMSNAAKVIGNTDLEEKFLEAIRMIKRDIVFAPSLYL